MDKLIIEGGKPLSGAVKVQGSKNALLPILASSVINPCEYTLTNCPRITDAYAMAQIIELAGGKLVFEGNTMRVDTSGMRKNDVPPEQTRAMRSSVFLLGPMLSRFHHVSCAYPGGCAIGSRPIDLHIKGFRTLGVCVEEIGGRIICDSTAAHAGSVHLDFPSVGATENLMMLAASLDGVTEIKNAAREPEIVDLQNFMQAQGIQAEGAGSSTVRVTGGIKYKQKVNYNIMPDRIAAGTILCATAATHGKTELHGVDPDDLSAVCSKLSEIGCKISVKCDTIFIDATDTALCAPQIIETMPYPGFPTDMQAPMLALCTVACGTSVFCESIYENRYRHAAELRRMGADITICGRTAVVRGGTLHGATVSAEDLRGGAALVIAGLAADGTTVVENADRFIDRGYESIENTLSALGADIKRIRK